MSEDNFTIHKSEDKDYYHCNNCNFNTCHLYSIQRHILNKICQKTKDKIICNLCKKKFQFKSELDLHLQNKKPCVLINKEQINQQIEQNEQLNKNELLKKIEDLNYQNKNLNENNIKLNEQLNNYQNNFKKYNFELSHELSDLLIERNENFKKKNKNFELEIKILNHSLFIYKNNNFIENKKLIFLLFNYLNFEKLDLYFNKIQDEHKEYIQFVIDYFYSLNNNDETKIYDKNKQDYLNKLKQNINLYFNIDL
jgi:hypothetical protein